MGEEVSNKVVLILALLVVLVVAVSTWLVLNKLSAVDLPSEAPQPKVVYVTETITEGPAPVGRVALSILPPVEEEHKMVDTNKALTILLVVALFVSVFGALSAMNKVDSF